MSPFKLRDKQTLWLTRRKIEVGGMYMLPRYGFHAYETAGGGPFYMDTNPFTKSLDNAPVECLEIRSGFYRVNFCEHRAPRDWWMDASFERRDWLVVLLLTIVCYIPMVIYNTFRK